MVDMQTDSIDRLLLALEMRIPEDIYCLMYCIVSLAMDAAKLQQYLTNLQKWDDDWLMSFNPDKCEFFRVTNKRKTYPATYSIRGQELNQVDSNSLALTLTPN